MLRRIVELLLRKLFRRRRTLRLAIYGPPSVGKTTIANRISLDWLGEEVGKVSGIPHETRRVQWKERIEIKLGAGRRVVLDLFDMPGIATKVDYRAFMEYELDEREARQRAKEATQGVIEAIKWLDKIDAALVVMDSTQDPYTQVNIIILGNLEARKIPVIIVANKIDLEGARPELIEEAFPQHPVVKISGLTGENMEELYETILKRFS